MRRAPSALVAHLLALENKDAFCSRAKLKLAPEGGSLELSLMGRWHVDRTGLLRCGDVVYVPNDRPARMGFLRLYRGCPWLVDVMI